MKKLRIANLDQYAQPKDGLIVYKGTPKRTVALEINPVGPVAAYLVTAGKKPERYLLAVIDDPTEISFTWKGDFAVQLEGEAWVRRDQTPVFVEADPELPVYTRFEKVGLYHDEVGMALHRQAVLQRLQASGSADETSLRAQRLEDQLAKQGKLIEELLARQPIPVPLAKLPEKEGEDEQEPSK